MVLAIALFQILGDPDSIWPYLTFTQNMVWAADGHWGPTWTGVTWSLVVEEQFYLMLPLIVWATPPCLLPAAVLALCSAAPIARWLCAHWLYSSHYASYMLTSADARHAHPQQQSMVARSATRHLRHLGRGMVQLAVHRTTLHRVRQAATPLSHRFANRHSEGCNPDPVVTLAPGAGAHHLTTPFEQTPPSI